MCHRTTAFPKPNWQAGAILAIALLAVCSGGCANWNLFGKNVTRNQSEDVGPQRETRKEQVAQDFDKRRDDALFNAAASAWQRGDTASCEQNLQQLLSRTPTYSRARLLLADLYLFNGQPDQAIEELSKAVAADPKDAAAQHSLAEALDAAGRRPEALPHYELATQLEPRNEVFALSFKGALGVAPAPTKPTASTSTELAAGKRLPAGSTLPGKLPAASLEIQSAVLPVQASPIQTGSKLTLPEPPLIPLGVAAQPARQPNRQLSQSNSAATIADPQQLESAEKIAWRLSGSISTPSQPREFENPASNMDQWLEAMHFEPTASPQSSSLAAAPGTAPKQLESAPAEAAVEIKTAKQIQPSPSTHPATPVVQAAYPTEPVDPQILQSPLQTAVAALAKGEPTAAIDAATRGLTRTPDQAAALYRVLGAAHYRRGEYAAAQAALGQALSLDKSDALAYFLMGSTLAKQNEREAAAKYFAEAARLDARFAQ